MAIKEIEGNMNVLEAARVRIINAFDTGLDIKLSMSGGKDSICLADIVFELIKEGRINPKQLTVQFIDEEAILDEVERVVMDWRRKFMLVGAKFEWYCIQVRHFNCLNSLINDESFITWDEYEKENWVRPMPSFAIKTHPLLRERKDTYQDFLPRINKGAIQLIGIRAAESAMRRTNIATITANKKNDGGLNADNSLFPIYDWTDDDVWYHIKSRKLDFPETYMDLWRIGEGRRGMRISQFFSIDTAKLLARLNEHQPGLMERVIKREPNAYLVSLYWESEMFRRGRKNRTKEQEDKMDYKKEVLKQLRDIPSYFEGEVKRETVRTMKSAIAKVSHMMSEKHYKLAYQILQAGDPKKRALRGFLTTVAYDYTQENKKARKK